MKLLVRKPDHGYLDQNLWVPRSAVNVEGVQRALTFQIVERGTPSLLTLWRETKDHIVVPREFWRPTDFTFPVIDCRQQQFPSVDIRSRIKLDHRRAENGSVVPTGRNVQREAMDALALARGGILQIACGVGKTVIALAHGARRGVPVLIIVDTTQLMQQWMEEIALHLEVPGGVGRIQADVFDWQHPIVLTTYQTIGARAATLPEEVRRWFGTIFWDEAHHVNAPTFSRSAALFDGQRLGLTATPHREDGSDVIHSFHIGPVIYKNLQQALKPKIYFRWTGFGVNLADRNVAPQVLDTTGELHIGKVASYLGQLRPRIDFVLNEVDQAVNAGRKVLVISKSVDALVNMLAAWNGHPSFVTDIPFPSEKDVGETIPPKELTEKDNRRLGKAAGILRERLGQHRSKDVPKDMAALDLIKQSFAAHEVYKKCERAWDKKRAEFIKQLLLQPSTAGLMIGHIKVEQRMRMLREKQVVFCIAKYGREGLDEKKLNTLIVNEPASREGGVQQLLGRVLREVDNDNTERIVVFLEDDIGPFIGMCQKIRKLLREWPADKGGKLDYENLGHPTTKGTSWKPNDLYRTKTVSIRAPGR
jgi:superfamily II DNA or RNA helicase